MNSRDETLPPAAACGRALNEVLGPMFEDTKERR